MRVITISVCAALAAQFISLPFVIGARNVTEAIGWNLILGIFIAIPSIVLYGILFSALFATRAPAWVIIPVSILVPATIVVSIVGDVSMKNWLLVVAILGGLAGGVALTMQAKSLA